MPPKKDKKKKDGKKKKDSAVPDVPDDEERELLERELALTYLRNKVGKYQENQEFLATENAKLQVALDKEKTDLRDINEILTSELKVANVVCETLEKSKHDLEDRVTTLHSELQATVDRLQRERDDAVKRLRDEIASFKAQLSGVDDFLRQKADLESDLAQAKETIVRERKDFADKLGDMERQHVQDRERWKKELALKVKETKTQMLRLTDQQLEITTKRTIMENELMSSELSYQMTQTEQLTNRNKDLLSTNSEYKMQIELAKLSEQELAKRNLIYQRSIRSMLQKIKVQEERLESVDAEHKALEERWHVAEERASELHVLLRESQDHQRLAEGRYEALVEEVEQWRTGHGEVATLLMTSLHDAKRDVAASREEDVDASEVGMDALLSKSTLESRTNAVRRLLTLVEQSVGAAPSVARASATAAARASVPRTPRESSLLLRPSIGHPSTTAMASTSKAAKVSSVTSTLPPLHKLSVADRPPSSPATLRDPRTIVESSEFPSVELLMYQLAQDVRPWGGKVAATGGGGKKR